MDMFHFDVATPGIFKSHNIQAWSESHLFQEYLREVIKSIEGILINKEILTTETRKLYIHVNRLSGRDGWTSIV